MNLKALLIFLSFIFFTSPLSSDDLRIISTAPSITEILYAPGAGDMIVGVSSYCDYPKETRLKEKIGTFSAVNTEKLVSLKPDIVFTTGLEQGIIIKQLDDIGHQVHIMDLLKSLNTKKSITMLCILHDLNIASDYCDRRILLDDGKILGIGTPEEIINYRLIEDAYKTTVVIKPSPATGKPHVVLTPKI